jgi:hypothetical protein
MSASLGLFWKKCGTVDRTEFNISLASPLLKTSSSTKAPVLIL